MPFLKFQDLSVSSFTYEQIPAFVANLKGFDALHAIFVELTVRNVAAGAPGKTVFNAFGQVVVRVDGGAPLVALTPLQALKIHLYRTGRLPPIIIDQRGNAYQRAVIPVFFGNTLADASFYLNTNRFNAAQLFVTVPDASGGGSFDATQTSVRVWAAVASDGVFGPQVGYFRYTSLGQVQLTGTGTKEILITRGPRYSRLFLIYDHPTSNISAGLGFVKLWIGTDSAKVSEATAGEITDAIGATYPFEWHQSGVVLAANNGTADVLFGNIAQAVVNSLQPDDPATSTIYLTKVTGISGRTLTFGAWTGRWTGSAFAVAADTTARPIVYHTKHTGIPDVLVLDFLGGPGGDVWRTDGLPDLKITIEDKLSGPVVTLIGEILEAP
jgi:hypothetical protein